MEGIDKEDLEAMESAPRLASLSRQNPFAVPSGYFEQLEAASVRAAGDTSATGQGATPFAVPDHYFDRLPDKISERIRKEETRKVPLLLRPVFGLSLAAASVALLLLWRNGGDSIPQPAEPASLTSEDIQASGMLTEMEQSAFVEMLEETDVQPSTGPDADIENYLIENQIDLYQITNAL